MRLGEPVPDDRADPTSRRLLSAFVGLMREEKIWRRQNQYSNNEQNEAYDYLHPNSSLFFVSDWNGTGRSSVRASRRGNYGFVQGRVSLSTS